ncbi:MAG: hypothetical protein ACI4MA_03255 [Treponema sp.]
MAFWLLRFLRQAQEPKQPKNRLFRVPLSLHSCAFASELALPALTILATEKLEFQAIYNLYAVKDISLKINSPDI